MKKKTINKYFRWFLSSFFILGLIGLTGFLAVGGVLWLQGPLYLAIGAFFLAGGIEGEIYAQNITKFFQKFFNWNYLRNLIIEKKLKALLQKHTAKLEKTKKTEEPKYQFLFLYLKTKARIKELKAQTSLLKDSDTPDDQTDLPLVEKNLKQAKKQLKELNRFFKKFLTGKINGKEKITHEHSFYSDLNQLFTKDELTHIKKELNRKKWLGYGSALMAGGAGISAGLVGVNVAQTSILTFALYFGLHLSAIAMVGSIYTLGILAAFGYVFLIYNMLTDMIYNDTLQNWARGAIKFFERGETKEGRKENIVRYIARVVGASLSAAIVVGLAIFMTVATAGTWWFAAKNGAALIPYIKTIGDWLSRVTVPIMALAQLLFNSVNSLMSLEEIKNISPLVFLRNIKNTVINYWNKENIIQFLNPFRFLILLISFPFKIVVFLGHLASMAFISDGLVIISALVTSIINAMNEFFQDLHFLTPEHHHKKCELKDLNPSHKKESHEGDLTEKNEEGKKDELTHQAKPVKHKHAHDHSHHHEHQHNHTHTDIPGKFLKLILSPLYLLSILWDSGWSQLNYRKKNRLSFIKAAKKAYLGLPIPLELEKAKETKQEEIIDKPQPDSPNNSWKEIEETWKKIEKNQRMDRKIKKAKLTEKELEGVIAYKNELIGEKKYGKNDLGIAALSFFYDTHIDPLTKKLSQINEEYQIQTSSEITANP